MVICNNPCMYGSTDQASGRLAGRSCCCRIVSTTPTKGASDDRRPHDFSDDQCQHDAYVVVGCGGRVSCWPVVVMVSSALVVRRSLVFVFVVSVVGTMALTKMLLVPTCRARCLDRERSAVVLLETERRRFFES
jgi:hypothetical protein